jgi:hypothetical protein
MIMRLPTHQHIKAAITVKGATVAREATAKMSVGSPRPPTGLRIAGVATRIAPKISVVSVTVRRTIRLLRDLVFRQINV